MIFIKEIKPPRKVSGISSFIVSFDYNPNIVNALKSIPSFYYHTKTKEWEFSPCYLSLLLDTLTMLDDISLTLLPNNTDTEDIPPLTEEELAQFKFPPFKHQIDAINFGMTQRHRWLLLDSMGVGKTNTIIWLAEALKRRGLIEHCLIICGVNSIKQNWKNEIKKFSTESCMVLGERITRTGSIRYDSVADRAKRLKEPIDEFFIITNIETLRSDEIIKAIKAGKNNIGMLALDEAHKCASKSSAQGKNLLEISAEYMVAATGTPITNDPVSCYVPLAWTKNEHSTLTTYKNTYCVQEPLIIHNKRMHAMHTVGYQNLDLLKNVIKDCSLRRTLYDVAAQSHKHIFSKTVSYELVEMAEDHAKFYSAIKASVTDEAIKKNYNEELNKIDKIKLNTSNLLALTTRLRQAADSPSILTTETITSSKIERCADLVEELVSQGEKVVIFASFKETVYALAERLKEFKPLVNTGDISDGQIAENVETLQTSDKPIVFIGTWFKVGTGWTLNAAQYLICIDTPFTYSQFSQGTDRIWRVNNTHPAFVKVLVAKDTIDEHVVEIIERKKNLSNIILDENIDANSNNADTFTPPKEDLAEILVNSLC